MLLFGRLALASLSLTVGYYTAVSINVVRSKLQTATQDQKVVWVEVYVCLAHWILTRYNNVADVLCLALPLLQKQGSFSYNEFRTIIFQTQGYVVTEKSHM